MTATKAHTIWKVRGLFPTKGEALSHADKCFPNCIRKTKTIDGVVRLLIKSRLYHSKPPKGESWEQIHFAH